jgi:hypothetical protein
MKTKKIGIGVFLALALVAVFSMNADAADAYYTCTIDRVGGQIGGTPMVMYVMLSDTQATPKFTKKYFRVLDANKNQVMAVLLTALSLNSTVLVYTDPDLPTNYDRLLKQLYVDNQ